MTLRVHMQQEIRRRRAVPLADMASQFAERYIGTPAHHLFHALASMLRREGSGSDAHNLWRACMLTVDAAGLILSTEIPGDGSQYVRDLRRTLIEARRMALEAGTGPSAIEIRTGWEVAFRKDWSPAPSDPSTT